MRTSTASSKKEKFLLDVIAPAIRGQSCPICLKSLHDHGEAALLTVCLHAYCVNCIRRWSDFKRKCPLCNADFASWFCRISLSSRKLHTEKLPPPDGGEKIAEPVSRDTQRVIRRSREEMNVDRRRRKPLPWRRTFGRPGSVPFQVILERKLEWRASVYKRGLRAVPLPSKNCLEQGVSGTACKETMLQRIEPWIRRELQAILEDPDPSVIVHVASSLFIASVERKIDVSFRELGAENNFLAQLRTFLSNWTDMFWHELRCFAESSLNMETYDAVVKYRRTH